MVEKVVRELVELVLREKRARTGPLRMCIADRSTIITILSSGPGVFSFVTNSQMKNPFEFLNNNAFAE